MTDTVLVAGAGGVIGKHVADTYAARGVPVRGVSRRPVTDAAWEHLSVDLLDPESARRGLAGAADTTHLVFAAYIERPTVRELSQVNVALLENTLDALVACGAPGRTSATSTPRPKNATHGWCSPTSTTTRKTCSAPGPPSVGSTRPCCGR